MAFGGIRRHSAAFGGIRRHSAAFGGIRRWRIWRIGLVGIVLLAAALMAAYPGGKIAQAATTDPTWTHLFNSVDTNQDLNHCGYIDTDYDPCLYYAQPAYQSSSISVYVFPELYCSGCLDWRTAINQSFGAWNGISAYNPFMYACYTYQGSGLGQCGQGEIRYGALGCNELGETTNYAYTAQYNSTYNQYYAIAPNFMIDINNGSNGPILWNSGDTNNGTSCNNGKGTSSMRDAVAHETGHAELLGHAWHTNSNGKGDNVMYPGAVGGCDCYIPQAGDIAGARAIYPGYYPSASVGPGH